MLYQRPFIAKSAKKKNYILGLGKFWIQTGDVYIDSQLKYNINHKMIDSRQNSWKSNLSFITILRASVKVLIYLLVVIIEGT